MSAAKLQATCPRDAMLTEFLEAFIHQVLFLRGVYNQELFERRRLYNIAVRKAAHPGLVAYVRHLVLSLKDGIASGNVRNIVVVLLNTTHQVLEKFVLSFKVGQLDQVRSPLELEAALRSMLLKLSMTGSALHPLPPGGSFKVLACATSISTLSPELWAGEFATRRVQQFVDFVDPDTVATQQRDNAAAADIDVAHQITPIKTISVAGSLHMQLYVVSSLS